MRDQKTEEARELRGGRSAAPVCVCLTLDFNPQCLLSSVVDLTYTVVIKRDAASGSRTGEGKAQKKTCAEMQPLMKEPCSLNPAPLPQRGFTQLPHFVHASFNVDCFLQHARDGRTLFAPHICSIFEQRRGCIPQRYGEHQLRRWRGCGGEACMPIRRRGCAKRCPHRCML